ncbi:MAG: hypothetical protein KKA55_07680 [Proteobacteria bacterium]|nr:hypothetical protein [Pseudomonadota bacterium]MBU1595401.1 hypothetical protein [Pseudomonadota bacterium]
MSKAKTAAALRKLAELYRRMDAAYAKSAAILELSCSGCADSCCETVFRHHTYVEWAGLWAGLTALPGPQLDAVREAAGDWVRRHQNPVLPGVRPRVPCPLCEESPEGLRCGLYHMRPMVCRLHGVPNVLLRPGRGTAAFPGCDRAQALGKTCEPALLDRTPLLTELARLEMDLVGRERMGKLPRVDLTIAEMILLGPPKI